MDPVTAGLIVGGVGGIASYFGQESANEANAEMQAKTNLMNAIEAQKNRQWQTDMSNTAHVRERADLKAAGYNPILGAIKGGASTPGGSVATAQAARVEDSLGKGISSARESAALADSLRTANTDRALKDASTVAQTASTAQSVATAKKITTETEGATLDNLAKRTDLPARKKEAQLREVTADYDKSAAGYDAIMNRALNAIGGVTSAIGKVFRGGSSQNETLKRENKTMKDYIKRR